MAIAKSLILEDIRRVAAILKRAPTRDEYAGRSGKKLGTISEHEIRNQFGTFSNAIVASLNLQERTSVVDKDGYQIARMREELGALKSYVKELEEDSLNSAQIRDIIGSVDTTQFSEQADWIKGSKVLKASLTGIPTLFISDVHFDEVVRPEQINFVNEYNHEIAVARIKHTFQMAIDLTKKHLVKPQYDGFICAFGGDILTGNIHEELAETNDQTINRSIMDITDLFITGVSWLADEFGQVFVPCVVGNHGRMHRKPRFKYKVEHNHEWLVYQYMQRHFKNDKRVSFYIPDAPDAQWTCYGRTYNLNHGDQFKGGTGIAGLFSPLMLGMARKQKKQNAIGQPFDVMLNGHWHQYIHTDSLIINGSIKGYDEYANGMNLPFEPPQQAMWISHPTKRETFRMPILCEESVMKKQPLNKLSWPSK